MIIMFSLFSPHCWDTGLLYRLYIRKTGKTHRAAQCRLVGANDCQCSRDQRLNVLPKHGEAGDDKFLVTHPMTNQCCLAFAILRRAHRQQAIELLN
jgi:hypothetical protein